MILLHNRIELTIAMIVLLAACGGESVSDNSTSNNDRDSDDILDSLDKCPNTSAEVIPSADGCVKIDDSMTNNILVGGAGSR